MTLALSCAFALALAACGGGGGAASDAPATISTTTPPTPAASSPVTTTSSDPGNGFSNSGTVATVKALSVAASLAVEGIPEQPTVVPAAAAAAAGSTYFVDSAAGDDGNDGLSGTSSTAGRGPWRTLSRVMQSKLGAGDVLTLACGSVWSETLRLPASGSAARPVVVTSAQSPCAQPPVIDGGVSLAPTAWTLHQGKIFKAPLASAPTLVTASGTQVWTEAHHPNRGYSATDPTSPYVYTAAASDIITVNGQPTSQTLVTGGDLALPTGTQITPGTRVGVRIYSWWFEERKITAVAGSKLTFDNATSYPVSAGRGYFFKGQLWMVDSAGEWYYDATAKQLYAYMPDGVVPAEPLLATTLAVGIDLQSRESVIIDGLTVRRTGVGMDLRGSKNVVLRNSAMTDIAGVGADATGSTGAIVEASAFTRTGGDAVSSGRPGYPWSSAMAVRNNVVRDSGVVMSGDTVLSQPSSSFAAIYAGPGSTVSGNVVVNAGYNGIVAQAGSVIEKNFVYGACTVLDDCGGIYVQLANNNNVIRGNTVLHTRGALAGKPASEAIYQAQGIYLDESVTGALVEDNTVIDAENGIQLHVSSNNIIRGNRLYGNRNGQIWLQADVQPSNPTRTVADNQIVDNLIAPLKPGAVGIRLETNQASVSGFGTIDRNRYYDRVSPVVVSVSTSAGTTLYSASAWKAAPAANLPLGRDAAGGAVSETPYTSYRSSGTNLVPNASLAVNAAGWNPWNAAAPAAQVVRESCPAGTCVRLYGGGSPAQLSTPNFSVQSGQWYRLSFDLAASSDGVNLWAIVRRGGGGSNGYESVSVRDLPFTANRAWTRYTAILQSTLTINAHDPVTLDNGARVDFSPVPVGQSISVANVELVPIGRDSSATVSGALVNVGSSTKTWACPYATSQPALCDKFKFLQDNSAVAWQVTVSPYSAALMYSQEPTLLDSDGDGIADVDDQCPSTPNGQPVNAVGCPLTLR